MKTNVAACSSVGSYFYPQIGRIYHDMLSMYKACSGMISESVVRDGKTLFPSAFDCQVAHSLRTGRHKDAQSPRNADDQEGNLETHRYIRFEGR